jgi:hypothetical protein
VLLGTPAGSGPFCKAYRRLYDALAMVGSGRIRRQFYLNLPAYTQIMIPSAYGLVDLGEPEFMEERGSFVALPIAGVSTTSPVQVTTGSPHGLTVGSTTQEAVVGCVGGTQSANGRWFVTVIDASSVTLNGSVSDGLLPIMTQNSMFSMSTEKFTDMSFTDRISDRDVTDRLYEVLWEEECFKFRGATQARELRITYTANGIAPTLATVPIGLTNSDNFLATATAGFAAQSRGFYQMADRLFQQAYGPKGIADSSGGMLREFIAYQVREMQRTQRRRMPFRQNHNRPDFVWM